MLRTVVQHKAMDNLGLCNLQIGLSFFVQEHTHNGSISRDPREDKVGRIRLSFLIHHIISIFFN